MQQGHSTPRIAAATGTIRGEAFVTATTKVKRGAVAYTFFYMVLGLALGLFWTVVQVWPYDQPDHEKAAIVLAGTALLTYLILFNGWFQNKLLGWKAWWEGAWR